MASNEAVKAKAFLSDEAASSFLEQKKDKPDRLTGEEMVLTFLFGVLLAGVVSILAFDLRFFMSSQPALSLPFLPPADMSRPIAPARDHDQIRHYSPQTRVDFGPNTPPNLPGVSGPADRLLSGSMTFHTTGKGVASAVGFIDAGTAIRFDKFIAQQEASTAIHTLYFHSPGGSVRDAIEIAHSIRAKGIATAISQHGYCASSCPLAFAGGKLRTIAQPAALGVHQVFTSDTATGTLQQGIANAQAISAEAQQLLIEMGVDPRAWIKAMATHKDKLYLFTEKEIGDLKWTTK